MTWVFNKITEKERKDCAHEYRAFFVPTSFQPPPQFYCIYCLCLVYEADFERS